MAVRTIRDIEKVWSNVEGIKKLSDRAIGIGPFGVGMDGLLTWIPVVGGIYSVGAGLVLLTHAIQARASASTMARMLGYLGLDALTTEIPIAGDLIDTVFQGHGMAAKALQKDIESTHWIEGTQKDAEAAGLHDSHKDEMRRTGKRRIVYLGD